MVKGIIKIGLIAIVAILGYNYFAGTPEEKENAHEIVNKVKSIGGSIGDLIKAERLKYKEGKYDEVLNKMGTMLRKIKDKAADGSDKLIEKLEKIDNKRKDLKERLKDTDNLTKEDKNDLENQLKKLVDDANNVANDLDD